MANCHNLFENFLEEVSIPLVKRDRMLISKDKLRKRIRKYFVENHPGYYPMFYIQGSYKMKTAIRTIMDICDLDDGVYFFRIPGVTATTLQGWVWDAVNGYTNTTPEHRKKCIRSIFEKDYEIDMPVYYKVEGENYKLAVKNTGWEDSDPKAFITWFNGRKDGDKKLINAIKQLKDWCDYKPGKMASGLALSILATNAKAKIVLNERSDISLKDILKEIKKALDLKFECIVPALPNDNLFADYDSVRKDKFLNCLNEFIIDAEAALKEENQLAASELWRKHLGKRFPLGANKKDDTTQNSAIVRGASLSNPWCDD